MKLYHSQLPPATKNAVYNLIESGIVRGVNIDDWCGQKTISAWISYCFVFSLYDNDEEVKQELLTLWCNEDAARV